jgi:uncharacterized protein (DUF1015 family)
VPYDVVSTAEARARAAGNPWSFLRVSRAEIDLPDGTDPYSDAVYQKAVENFARLRRDAPLITEDEARLYAYRLRMGDHVQTGVAGSCSLREYDQDIVRKHERTRRDKEDDRTRHMVALRAQTGPVFLTYRGVPEIDARIGRATAEPPLYDFEAPDGIRHTVWRLYPEDSKGVERAFAGVPLLYIADGHHRAASAARARGELRQSAPGDPGSAEFDFFLGIAFPAGQVRILPYNRVVRDLNGLSPAQFISKLRREFELTEGASPSPLRKGEVSVYLGGRWYGLPLHGGAAGSSAGTSSLDASLVQERILEPLLGVHDIRTDKRIDFIGGIRGPAELERLVDSGRAAIAFSLYPVSLDELMAIADANEIMPPKSTWFEPKLRDGMLIHQI